MTSARQIATNRRNALKNTGPSTPASKAIVSRNALKHGLCSRQVLLPDESETEWELFHRRLFHQLAPLGELESFIAERIIAAAWRLQRLVRIESEMMLDDLHRLRNNQPLKILLGNRDQPQTLGAALAQSLRGSDIYSKFRRYETSIERGLFRNLHELQRLQAARLGRDIPLPVPIDVTITSDENPDPP